MKGAFPTTLFGIALCLGLVGCNAKAQEKAVYGAGLVSCAEWQKVRVTGDNGNSYQARAWVDGYLSGYNVASADLDILNDAKPLALYAWIDNYCASHPLDALITAVFRLQKELLERARR